MTTATNNASWEAELADLLNELSTVQGEMLDVLQAKRECMANRDLPGMSDLQATEIQIGDRLQACHDRRGALLATARSAGVECDTLGKLAKQLPAGKRETLGKQVDEAAIRTRLMQHESLTNWVVAQRTVLHLSQLIEIIATGGRLQPTYGKNDAALARGALVDQEA
ncbi:MAG TPA: flagellar export chaperone FlgN [Pirellulaceae bacterium]|nr:flagellar export chaperone FlgN [Pirellulaceae bacterium]